MSLLDTASLIVTPNGYKEGKLYSVIPSDGSGDLSVTRATTATRVNSQGLVELVPYNLMLSSEDFTTNWVASGCSVTANTTTAPNGTTTADTVTDSSTFGYVYLTSASVNTSQIVTHSVFLKRTNNDWINVSIARGGATTYGEFGVWFNLATGAIGSNFQAGAGVLLDSEITDEGNGWYRCSITGYVTNAVSYVPYVFNSNADNSFTSSSGQSRYQWGAQLVEGSVAKDYQKTETRLNIPRLDYYNGTCPSILVEPQRTNSCLWSSDINNSTWIKAYMNIVLNAITAPDGTLTADKLIPSATPSVLKYTYNPVSVTSGVQYTYSTYAKADEYDKVRIEQGNNGQGVWFDLTNGTVLSNPSSLPTTIEEANNGWYRISITFTTVSTTLTAVIAYSNTTSLTVGNGVNGGYIWGVQVELGSYATSYIPTTSASVTRNADVISKTGISSLIGQTEGTCFVDFNYDNSTAQGNPILFSFRNTAWTSEVYAQFLASGGIQVQTYLGGVQQSYLFYSGVTNGHHKIAYAYKQNDFVLYVDGVQVATDTSGSVPTTDDFCLGYFNTAFTPSANYNASALWKTRLTNTQLAQLTTI